MRAPNSLYFPISPSKGNRKVVSPNVWLTGGFGDRRTLASSWEPVFPLSRQNRKVAYLHEHWVSLLNDILSHTNKPYIQARTLSHHGAGYKSARCQVVLVTHHGEASKPEKAWAGGIYAAARLDEWTAESKPAPVASRAGSSRAKCTIPGTFVPKESLHRLKDSYMKSTCRDVYTCKSGDRACKSKLRPWDYSVQTLGEGTLWSWLEGASLTHRLEALTL